MGYSTNLKSDDSRRIEVFSAPQVKNGLPLPARIQRIESIPFPFMPRRERPGSISCYPLLAEDSESDTLMLLESSECGGF